MTHDVELTPLEQRCYDEFTKRQPVVIQGEPEAQTVWLRVGVQSFCMDAPAENAEEADWRRAMLAKALALHPALANVRIVLVTDRIDLDKQLWGTFQACGKTAMRARSGQHLAELIRAGSVPVITTVIDKFETAAKRYKLSDPDPNTFLLVDEGHRRSTRCSRPSRVSTGSMRKKTPVC